MCLSIFYCLCFFSMPKCILQMNEWWNRETKTLSVSMISVFILIGSSTGSKLENRIKREGLRFIV